MNSRLLALMRPRQWSKNALLLAPVALHHQITDPHAVAAACAAALVFCLASSSGYIINDLLDVKADQSHPVKRLRPLAAGTVPPRTAACMAALLAMGAASSYWLSTQLAVSILIYWVMSILYSAFIKKFLVVDVVMLAGFYIIRMIAGGLSIGISLSFWTLAFSMFLFFSLALIKRYAELRRLSHGHAPSDEHAPGRAYRPEDLLQVNILGGTSSLLAVLVIGLYVSDPSIRAMYGRPDLLWLLCPIMLGWSSRVWILAGRGEMNEDPVAFALTDRWSYFAGILMVLVVLGAISGLTVQKP